MFQVAKIYPRSVCNSVPWCTTRLQLKYIIMVSANETKIIMYFVLCNSVMKIFDFGCSGSPCSHSIVSSYPCLSTVMMSNCDDVKLCKFSLIHKF